MTGPAQVRWGIIGTANIARGAFLPGLRHAGGVAAAVAGRDLAIRSSPSCSSSSAISA